MSLLLAVGILAAARAGMARIDEPRVTLPLGHLEEHAEGSLVPWVGRGRPLLRFVRWQARRTSPDTKLTHSIKERQHVAGNQDRTGRRKCRHTLA